MNFIVSLPLPPFLPENYDLTKKPDTRKMKINQEEQQQPENKMYFSGFKCYVNNRRNLCKFYLLKDIRFSFTVKTRLVLKSVISL